MATPERFLPDMAQELAALRRRVDYLDQRSQTARPVYLTESTDSASGAAVPATATVMTSVTVNVPVGYTSVLVVANVSAQAVNSRGVSDYLQVQPNIAGVDGWMLYRSILAGGADSVTSTMTRLVTGVVEGDPIVVQCKSLTNGTGWSADALNKWTVRAAFWFSR